MQKVLVITYYWPPSSGAGVQRWLKFSKYLPSFGWEPVILTIEPQYATFPAVDRSLEKDVSGELTVYKTRAADYFRLYRRDKSKIPSAGFATSAESGLLSKILRFVRGNFFVPDPRRGWNRYAFHKASEIIKQFNIGHVITTSPPHSTQLIGMRLKKSFPHIRWIADLRDPWTDIYYYSLFYHTPPVKAIDRALEKKVLASADTIITVGNTLAMDFIARLPSIRKKVNVITNGFDEDDFSGIISENPDKLTITYTGTLSESYPLKGFLEAVNRYIQAWRHVRLRFIGTVAKIQKDLILASAGNEEVEFIPHVDHQAAIRYMHDTSVLLLIIPDHRSSKAILTGKLFEYIACRKPVLCLGPVDGDASDIISETSSGKTFDHSDSGSILNFLENYGAEGPDNSADIAPFSRRSLTERLAKILSD